MLHYAICRDTHAVYLAIFLPKPHDIIIHMIHSYSLSYMTEGSCCIMQYVEIHTPCIWQSSSKPHDIIIAMIHSYSLTDGNSCITQYAYRQMLNIFAIFLLPDIITAVINEYTPNPQSSPKQGSIPCTSTHRHTNTSIHIAMW